MRTTPLLLLLCAGAVAVDGALVVQNRRLAADLSSCASQAKLSLEIPSGTRVGPIRGVDRSGESFVWDPVEHARPTILLVFQPHCGFCLQNWSNWQILMRDNPTRAEFLLVNLIAEVDDSFFLLHPPGAAHVLAQTDPASRAEYKMSMTPQTILIESDGRIKGVWSGVLQERDMEDIRVLLAGRSVGDN